MVTSLHLTNVGNSRSRMSPSYQKYSPIYEEHDHNGPSPELDSRENVVSKAGACDSRNFLRANCLLRRPESIVQATQLLLNTLPPPARERLDFCNSSLLPEHRALQDESYGCQ